jgi:hypothetical protein
MDRSCWRWRRARRLKSFVSYSRRWSAQGRSRCRRQLPRRRLHSRPSSSHQRPQCQHRLVLRHLPRVLREVGPRGLARVLEAELSVRVDEVVLRLALHHGLQTVHLRGEASLVGGLGEDAVKGLRPGRRIVGLCVTVWGAVRVMAAFCLRLIACTAKAEAIKQWCYLRETK